MKKLILNILAVSFIIGNVSAQKIDRSTAPKAGPAPKITINDPAIFKLKNGLTVLVVENHKLPKVSASLSIDAGPILEGNKAGMLNLLSGMLNEGTTLKSKVVFDQAVDQIGANVGLSANGGQASAMTRYFEQAFALMAEGLRKPLFAQESFNKLKSLNITDLKASEKSAKAISSRVNNALIYGKNDPRGEFITEASLQGLSLNDVKQAYKDYITPSRAYLTFVGDITATQAKNLAEKMFADWTGTSLTYPKLSLIAAPAKTEVSLVNLSTAAQAEITVANLIQLPLSSPDYFPLLIANQILGGGADSRLFLNLREKRGFTYGAYSQFNAGRNQTLFSASAAVRNEKVDSAVVEFLHEIKAMRDKAVSAEELQNAKNLFNGNFALGMENPARIASFAANILINDLPKDFYRTYLQKINAVSTADIQRVAQKYFNHDNTRIVIVGNAEKFESGLKKSGFLVKNYDNYANTVTASISSNIAEPAAAEIVKNYMQAIGGSANLAAVKDMTQLGEFVTMGQKLAFSNEALAPNLSTMSISMGGNVIVKEVFNGTTGYKSQMGQKVPYSENDLNDKKGIKTLFQALQYGTDFKIKNAGVSKVGNNDAFKVEVTRPSGSKVIEYYDVKTHLLLKDEENIKEGNIDMLKIQEYNDYKKVGELLIPHSILFNIQTPMGNQESTITIKEVKINSGLKAEQFN